MVINNMKYANIIPLIGGMTLGNIKATNNKPEFIVSFKDVFRDNDNHIVTYLNDVPYYDVSEFNLYNEYYEKLDFVSTVCPCAGISMMNVAKNSSASRSGYAKQNNWMYETAEWVLDKLRPKVFWGENAPTLVSKIGEPVRNKLLEIANKYNYSFSLYKTNTLLHGIPQNRARTFYFFWRDSKVPVLNWYKKPHEDILTYINKIPSDASLQDVYFANRGNPSDFMFHKFIMTKLNTTDEEFRKTYKGTLWEFIKRNKITIEEVINWVEKNYPNTSEMRYLNYIKSKLDSNMGVWDSTPYYSKTYVNAVISRGMYMTVHPTLDRFMNIREYMHLMGLPHDFELNFIKSKNYNHIAQNVPVNTAADITTEVIKYINDELSISTYSYLVQDNNFENIKDFRI